MDQVIGSTTELEQHRKAGKDFLCFTFRGTLTHKKAVELCERMKTSCSSNPGKNFVVVFNATNMENYEPQARVVFQKCIKELIKQIDKIWLVTDSKIIRGGASIMSLIIGLPIKAVKSEQQIVI